MIEKIINNKVTSTKGFEDLFGDSDWVRHSVKSLERSRNVIMHSGQLTLEDIERVGITIRDWVRQVGG